MRPQKGDGQANALDYALANGNERFCAMNMLLEAFERTVERFPNKVAVADATDSYTFEELRGKAREYGAELANENDAVLVYADRTCDTIIQMLAAMYANRVYVPLDPDMPQHKKHYVEAALQNMGEVADDATCVIFTSGSTGNPKGVVKGAHAYDSFIRAFCRTFQLDESQTIGNQTPFFFDASSKDVLLMMYSGATLEILPTELFATPISLVEYLNERKVTYTCWVPSAYTIVTQLGTFESAMPEYLQHAYFVGEQFPVKHLMQWMQTLPDVEFVNLYGSTELAGVCSYCRLDTGRTYERIPLGVALEGNEVFLAKDGKALPHEVGAEGEICVAGGILSSGYLHDLEGNEKRFVRMTTPSGNVARVLCTGDMARVDEDGELVFVGRSDFQIKYMGRRIELQEIEVAAEHLIQVDACCCVFDQRKKRIVMFCTTTEGHECTAREIKRLMRTAVSSYMMPKKIVVLDEMPHNANGKIDRTSLAARLA